MSRSELGFDPALARLAVIADHDAAASLFAPLPVRVLRRQDTKYQPGTRCVATFELAVDLPGEPVRRTFGVVTVTTGGASARLLDGDPELPALAEALDPARMRARFEAASVAPGVAACEASAVRYKPGARCVLRYRLLTGAGPLELYGKLLAGGVDGQLATVGALRAAAAGDPAMPAILPVTAAWPELGLLVQPAVAGAGELNELAFDPAEPVARREHWLAAAGRCLAAVHGCALPAAPARSHGDDLAELRGYLGPVGQADPALAARYAAVLDRLELAAGSEPEEPAGAGHGALRTDQFLVPGGGGRLVLIDLDTACRAEPARDLGNLLAYLDWKAIRRPERAAEIARAGELFLAGYAGARPAPAPLRLARHRAASLLKIAGRRYRSLTLREWPLVPRLVAAAGELAG